MERLEDATLVAAASDGDMDAFTALVHRHRQRVYVLIRRIVGDHHWADDLAQETFVKLWDHLENLRDGAAVGGWLRRVATNLGLNHVRNRKRHRETVREEIETVASDNHRPQAAAECRELSASIAEAIAALPIERRAALELRVHEKMSYEQISRKMNCSLGTVMSRLHRARLQVHEFLSASGQL